MHRRGFLQSSLAAGAALTLGFDARGQVVAPGAAAAGSMLGDFIRIGADGRVKFQLVKHEMGQGVATALAQILCEELDADWNQLDIEFPLADMARYQNDRNGGHDTGGSCTIQYQYDGLRRAGATARQMLIAAAAREWRVGEDQCRASNHFVLHEASGRRRGYGELAAAAAALPLPAGVKLKEERAFRLIGSERASKLVPDIATGRLKYGIDVQVPGMLHALIVRCPVFRGTLKSFDASAALRVPGVRKVFDTRPIAGAQFPPWMPHDIRAGVVVVADSFWAASKARARLRIEWDEGVNARASSTAFARDVAERALAKGSPTGFVGDEDAVADMARVRKTLRASYVYPQQLHSCMEPLNCTAHVTRDGCEIWCGSQAPNLIVSEIEKVLKIPAGAVRVHLHPSGGGYGRRYYPDFAVEAAFISREAGYLPVKMIWTREDDQTVNLAHHYQHMEYQAALDEHGGLHAWYEKELRTYTWGARYADPQLPAMAYDIPNIRYDFEDVGARELAHSSAWRGVVMHGKALSECFIDEIAAELKRDPVELRRSLLTRGRRVNVGGEFPLSSDRLRGVLDLAAEKAGWGRKLEAGRGMGVALIPYANTCIAAVAEVTVRERRLTLDRITLAVDCGRVINPSGARNQLVGGMIWSLTALLHGGLPIENGRAVRTNFHENKLLRMNECPVIDVHFVASDDERPWGLGEMSTPLGAPAVLNAVFAATGKRIRTVGEWPQTGL